jgi:hypothetical protein
MSTVLQVTILEDRNSFSGNFDVDKEFIVRFREVIILGIKIAST